MRIAFYLPSLALAGAERAALCVAQDIQRRGYDVRVIVDRRGTPDEEFATTLPVHNLKIKATALAGVALAKSLKQDPADVLIAVTTHNILSAALAKRLGQVSATLIGWEYDVLSALPGRGAGGKLEARMVRELYGACAKVVFPSTYAADDAVKFYGRISAVTIPGPAPAPLWQPPTAAELEIEAKLRAPRIVSSGPLTSEKDHLTLLRAFQIFARVKGGSLLLIGDGPARNMLELSASGLGLGERVVFAGAVDSPVNLLNLADMFVSSARYDPIGESIVEALALGLPIVATDCPGAPREILQRGKFGRLAPVGDPRGLWHAMRDSIDCSPDRDAMRKRAADFSVERASDALLALFEPEASPADTGKKAAA